MNKKHFKYLSGLITLCIALVALLSIHNVPTEPTAQDKAAITAMLTRAGALNLLSGKANTYEQQLEQIRTLQDAVLKTAPENKGIPRKQTREPNDLISASKGLCYDRSRTIEKALRIIGYTTRHVSIYHIIDNSPLKTMITPMVGSHSITEVLTERGWLVVDSNKPWLSIDAKGNPVSIKQMQNTNAPVQWPANDKERGEIYDAPFLSFIGLYSRHGEFYPPMTPLPDVNWPELLQNLQGS